MFSMLHLLEISFSAVYNVQNKFRILGKRFTSSILSCKEDIQKIFLLQINEIFYCVDS